MANEIRWVGNLERLELKPGDRFVLQVDKQLSLDQHRSIQEAWVAFIGDADVGKLLVIEPGMKLGAINTGEAAT
jgi:hypothetical protein